MNKAYCESGNFRDVLIFANFAKAAIRENKHTRKYKIAISSNAESTNSLIQTHAKTRN